MKEKEKWKCRWNERVKDIKKNYLERKGRVDAEVGKNVK